MNFDLGLELTNIDAIEGLRVEYIDEISKRHISTPLIFNNFNLGMIGNVKMRYIKGYEFQDVEVLNNGIISSKIMNVRFNYIKKFKIDLVYVDENDIIFKKERVEGLQNEVRTISLKNIGYYFPCKEDIIIKFSKDGEVRLSYKHIDYQIQEINDNLIKINRDIRKNSVIS